MSPSCTMRYAERSRPGGSAHGLPGICSRTSSPAARTSSTSASRSASPGCGASSSWSSSSAHRVEQAAHLRERGAARLLDVPERLAVLGRRLGHPVADGAHLEHHHADGVRDDVVQLPGDPAAFLGHRDPGRRLAVPLGPDRALLGGLGLLGPLVQREADQPADREQHRGEDQVAGRVRGVVVHDGRSAAEHDRQADAGLRRPRRLPSSRAAPIPATKTPACPTISRPSRKDSAALRQPGGRRGGEAGTGAARAGSGRRRRPRALEPQHGALRALRVVAQRRADGALERRTTISTSRPCLARSSHARLTRSTYAARAVPASSQSRTRGRRLVPTRTRPSDDALGVRTALASSASSTSTSYLIRSGGDPDGCIDHHRAGARHVHPFPALGTTATTRATSAVVTTDAVPVRSAPAGRHLRTSPPLRHDSGAQTLPEWCPEECETGYSAPAFSPTRRPHAHPWSPAQRALGRRAVLAGSRDQHGRWIQRHRRQPVRAPPRASTPTSPSPRRKELRQARPARAQRLPRQPRDGPGHQLQRPDQQHAGRRRGVPRAPEDPRERRTSRANGAIPITVAAGDLIGASPLLSAAFHDEPTIEAMNKIGLQVASVGNHEFDEGYRELKRMQHGGCLDDGDGANGQNSCPDGHDFPGADFQYLAANVKFDDPAAHGGHDRLPRPPRSSRSRARRSRFIGMTLKDTADDRQPGRDPGHRRSPTRWRPPTRSSPSCKAKGVKSIVVLLHEGVAPERPTDYNDCTGVTGPALGHRAEPRPGDRRRRLAATRTRPTTASCRTRRANRGCSRAPRRSAGWSPSCTC